MKLTKAQQKVIDICREHKDADLICNLFCSPKRWRLSWGWNLDENRRVTPRMALTLIEAGYFVEVFRNEWRIRYRLKESAE